MCWEEGLGCILSSVLQQRNAIGKGQLLSSPTHSANSLALVTHPMAFPGLNSLAGRDKRNRGSIRQSWPAPWFFSGWQPALMQGVSLEGVPLIGPTTQARVAGKILAQMRNHTLSFLPPPFTWAIYLGMLGMLFGRTNILCTLNCCWDK